MIKRIEQWLAGIFHKELTAAIVEIAALRAELDAIKEHIEATAKDLQNHAENVASKLHADVTKHTEETATNLHNRVATDARAILQFQQNSRLGCSWCGQLSRTYVLVDGKVKCADCQKKGLV